MRMKLGVRRNLDCHGQKGRTMRNNCMTIYILHRMRLPSDNTENAEIDIRTSTDDGTNFQWKAQ